MMAGQSVLFQLLQTSRLRLAALVLTGFIFCPFWRAHHLTKSCGVLDEATAAGHHQSDNDDDIKVFGIGLSRTATTSMAQAMTMMGYKTVHSDTSVGQFMHHPELRPNFASVYDFVDSVWGLPTAVYYKELHQAYPNAKFILTVRSSTEKWHSSQQSHFEDMYYNQWGCEIPERVQRLQDFVYGSRYVNDGSWRNAFERHNREVQDYFKKNAPNQLLVIHVDDDDDDNKKSKDDDWWKQLCSFTGSNQGPCAGQGGWFHSFPRFPHLAATTSSKNDNKKECPSGEKVSNAIGKTNPSKYAYAMVLCDPAINDRQNKYLLMLLVLVANIRTYDKDSDIIVLLRGPMMQKQVELLSQFGIQVVKVGDVGGPLNYQDPYHETERFPPRGTVTPDLSHCYMAKLRALQLTQYEKIMYVDSDILFTKDPTPWFQKPGRFYGSKGVLSPLNGGLYVMTPSQQSFADIDDIGKSGAFEPRNGWLGYGPIADWNSDIEGQMFNWTFFCAHSDQGLVYYYFDRLMKSAEITPPLGYMHFAGDRKGLLKDPEATEGVGEGFIGKGQRQAARDWIALSQDVYKKVNWDDYITSETDTNIAKLTPPAILDATTV